MKINDSTECTCGAVLSAERRGGWCSSWCQARDQSGQPPQRPPSLLPPPTAARRSIAADVERRLAEAGLLESWQASVALDLAETIDGGPGSGSARAALVRELRSTMAELLRGVDDAASAVGGMRNELQERRRRRAAGGGDR